jgi:hypothetical protein
VAIASAEAQKLFAFREKFRKYQATQKSVKVNAKVVELKVVKCPG